MSEQIEHMNIDVFVFGREREKEREGTNHETNA